MKDRPIITPTIRTLLDRRTSKREELFVFVPLALLERVTPLGPSAAFLFAVLYTLHRMHPRSQYFLLRPEFEAVIGRGYRWWHRHTQTLEQAGLIEVKRSDGSKPRYRLTDVAVKTKMKTKTASAEADPA